MLRQNQKADRMTTAAKVPVSAGIFNNLYCILPSSDVYFLVTKNILEVYGFDNLLDNVSVVPSGLKVVISTLSSSPS